jgi:hypothetical protein
LRREERRGQVCLVLVDGITVGRCKRKLETFDDGAKITKVRYFMILFSLFKSGKSS